MLATMVSAGLYTIRTPDRPTGSRDQSSAKGRTIRRPYMVGSYAPYVVERWTKLKGSELSLYYVLSTWNPYVVILMNSRLKVE
jgi:hypothetical protein